jgi:hypothetical protein
MQPRVSVTVNAQPAMAVVTVPPVRIFMRTHLWMSWARVALQHETMVEAARQELQQAGPENMNGRLLQNEADAGLVAICAAAFAIEALSRELDELVIVPPATLAAWRKKPPPADKQVLELLKLAVDPKGLVAGWKRELSWLFGVRGGAVHYRGVSEPVQAHPVGINVAVAQVTYSTENATRAVDLLLGILERCRDKPKPPVKKWSQDMRVTINELIGRRGQVE